MSELKAYEVYPVVGDNRKIVGSALHDDTEICLYRAQVYLKSEADKVIAHHKYKRCLGIAAVCFEKSYSTTLVKYDKESGLLRNFYDWWGKYWLKLAEKFKEK